MKHVCIDLETLDTRPTSVFLSLAAIQFDLNGNTGKTFKMNVELANAMKYGLTVGAGTLQFWLEQKPEIMKLMFEAPNNLRDVLIEFRNWVEDLEQDNIQMWGNSARFDLGILFNAYEVSETTPPWNFRNENCFRTMKNLFPAIAKTHKSIGESHDPLSDCYNQIAILQKIWRIISNDSQYKDSEFETNYGQALLMLDGLVNSSHQTLENKEMIQNFLDGINDKDFLKLIADHKKAMGFLQEISENESPAISHIRSRVKAFLHPIDKGYDWDINKPQDGNK